MEGEEEGKGGQGKRREPPVILHVDLLVVLTSPAKTPPPHLLPFITLQNLP